jgi:large subunit ribosomal protein L25
MEISMANFELTIEIREPKGKGAARKLRATGRVPGVYYGSGDSRAISFDPSALEHVISSSSAGINTLIGLVGAAEIEGRQVLVKDMQRDPVLGNLLHADLYAVDLSKKVTVSVPLRLIGIPVGVQLGNGILDHAMREIELECLPTSIPKDIEIDVNELDLGHSLHVRDLALPADVTLLSDANLSVVSVVAPKVEEEPVAAELEEGEETLVEEAAEGTASEEERAEAAASGGEDKAKDSG